MKKIKRFQKNDDWDECRFYKIETDDDGDKILVLLIYTFREKTDKPYALWAIGAYNYEERLVVGKLKELLEWGDIKYGISCKIGDMYSESEDVFYDEPMPVYEKVNQLLERENGGEHLWLEQVDEDTPCGLYFG